MSATTCRAWIGRSSSRPSSVSARSTSEIDSSGATYTRGVRLFRLSGVITTSSAFPGDRFGSTVWSRTELSSVAACGVRAATEAGLCVEHDGRTGRLVDRHGVEVDLGAGRLGALAAPCQQQKGRNDERRRDGDVRPAHHGANPKYCHAMEQGRYFTRDEANALLPAVRTLAERMVAYRAGARAGSSEARRLSREDRGQRGRHPAGRAGRSARGGGARGGRHRSLRRGNPGAGRAWSRTSARD